MRGETNEREVGIERRKGKRNMRDEEKAANLRKNKQKKNQKRKQNRAIDQTKQNQDKPK